MTCNCLCHTNKSVKHIFPCCTLCPGCGDNVPVGDGIIREVIETLPEKRWGKVYPRTQVRELIVCRGCGEKNITWETS